MKDFTSKHKDLRAGDTFLSPCGMKLILLESFREYFADSVTVYNVKVEREHNYFIVGNQESLQNGALPLLVHNAVLCKAPQGSRGQEQIMDEIRSGFAPKKLSGQRCFFR